MQISRSGARLDPFLRAGIVLFFGSLLCPFDDGNRRLTRIITGLGLAQRRQQAILLYAMTATILDDRAGYHRILEAIQKGTLDISAWLQWFLATLLNSLDRPLSE
ncbi:TPA: hypothetical protein ACRNIQ_001316 [Pseudomonas aeruginosa]|uniref:hypothetical protein n=1 Tax=Pseudomonas aeruginosa TaxID=287 RepID=UPI00388A9BD0|nr:hypothetical protein [Pseudomonas aeruginosa]HBN8408172.1 hypothetical protein [Pseudomonas aeruginosa]